MWDILDDYRIRLFVNNEIVKPRMRHSRLIYYWKDLVIKFEPDGEFFAFQCVNESEAWSSGIENIDKKYFAPIYDSGAVIYKENTPGEVFIGGYIVTKRFCFKRKYSQNDVISTWPKLNYILGKYEMDDVGFEYHNSKVIRYNCGITSDGKFKIYDYGLLES